MKWRRPKLSLLQQRVLIFLMLDVPCVLSEESRGIEAGFVCEQSIKAHFVELNRSGRSIIRMRPKDKEDDTFDCSKGFNDIRDPSQVWSISYSTSDKSKVQRPMPVSTSILNEYDYAERSEKCRNPDTGLEQLIFTLSFSGTANGDKKDALFLYYDRHKKAFSYTLLGAQFLDNTCSVHAAEQRYQHLLENREAGFKIYQSLRSPPFSSSQ